MAGESSVGRRGRTRDMLDAAACLRVCITREIRESRLQSRLSSKMVERTKRDTLSSFKLTENQFPICSDAFFILLIFSTL